MHDAYFELHAGVDGSGRWAAVDGAIIGRDPDVEITVPVAEVSRSHARVERRSDGWWLEDVGSRNGTFVDGVPVAEGATRLGDGALVVLAGRVTLRFVDLQATPLVPRIGRITGLWVDPVTRAVWVDARRVEPPLSDRQLALLELLYRHEGEVVARPRIVSEVWSDVAADGVSDDAVSALVKRVRARLREYESGHTHVEVVRTRGVRFRNPS